jgi:hypothetical protein
MKPVRIGRDRKLAGKPSRAAPAIRNGPPLSSVTAETSATWRAASPPASGATLAARIRLVAISGPMTSWRDEPKTA